MPTLLNRPNKWSTMSPSQIRNTLVRQSASAAVALNTQLLELLDAYDFVCERFADDKELEALTVSIDAVSVLPVHIASQLQMWAESIDPGVAKGDFDVDVLTELALHMQTLASFMERRDISINTNGEKIMKAVSELQLANAVLHDLSNTTAR